MPTYNLANCLLRGSLKGTPLQGPPPASRYEEVRAALLAGAPTAAVDAAGNGAAHLAACAGHACLLKLLLRKVPVLAVPSGSWQGSP